MPRFIRKTVARADNVRRLMSKAFPDYRRKAVSIVPSTSVALTELNWSGGTRSEYCMLTIDPAGNITAVPIGDHMSHPANNRDEGRIVLLDLGTVLVRAGLFCGKPSLASVYVRPEDIERVLGFALAKELMAEAA
jgi:hypothetical protein